MEQFFQELKKREYLVVSLVIIFGIFLAVLAVSTIVDVQNKIKQGGYIGQEFEVKNTITVSDTGDVFAKPDLALTSFSVATQAKTVAGAMAENAKKMNAVIDYVKGQGVEGKDLKTTGFNLYPRYEYQKVQMEIYPYPPGKRVLVGYEVFQSLQVKIRNMDKIGQIIEGAVSAGSNQAGDLRFAIDKEDELKAEARKQAIDKAKTKAEELADQLGVKLVRIVGFSEGTSFPPYYALSEDAFAKGGGGGTPQIETGENKISSTVTITYEIRN